MVNSSAKTFFSAEKVKKQVDKTEKNAIRKAAAYVWKVARNLIKSKKDPNKPSQPGNPPYNHAGFKKSIRFEVTNVGYWEAVIGPEDGRLGKLGKVLEFGGKSIPVKNSPVPHPIAARPFMRPAFERSKPRIAGYFANLIH